MNKKQTTPKVATTASQILRDGRYSDNAKSVAGSALSQTKTPKKTNDFAFGREYKITPSFLS